MKTLLTILLFSVLPVFGQIELSLLGRRLAAAGGGGGGIAVAELTQGTSNDTDGSFDTASITPTANAQVIVSVVLSKPGGNTTTTSDNMSVSGCNLTWSQVGEIASWSSRRATYIWKGVGASPSSGALTISFTASGGDGLTENQKYSVDEFTGVDSGTPFGTVYTQETTGTSVTATVSETPDSGDWVFFVGGTDVNEAMTLGGELETKLTQINDATGARTLTVAYDSAPDSNPTPSMSWSTSNVGAGVAFIINKQ